MLILGIETSCDETSGAVLNIQENKITVESQIIGSQIDIHKVYGGVVPEVAAREHVKNIIPIINQVLVESGYGMHDIDLVAVTRGPGLATSLMVGFEFGKTFAFTKNIPFVPVNHLAGHVFSPVLPIVGKTRKLDIKFPFLSLIISGGHTELVLVKNYNQFELLGRTLDDAVGEAFDKVAKMLGLDYPGGPEISKYAEIGDEKAFDLPRPMIDSDDFNFSFAGLKTAVLYQLKKVKITKKIKQDMSASFQKAAVDVLVKKTFKAMRKYELNHVVVVGGVSANKFLRNNIQTQANVENITLQLPELDYTGDNGAMIALAGYFQYKNNENKQDYLKLAVDPNLQLV